MNALTRGVVPIRPHARGCLIARGICPKSDLKRKNLPNHNRDKSGYLAVKTEGIAMLDVLSRMALAGEGVVAFSWPLRAWLMK